MRRVIVTGLVTNIEISGHKFFRTPSIWLESMRHAPVDRAGVVLPDPEQFYYRSIKPGDGFWLQYGYRDSVPAEFMGTVDWTRPSTGDALEVGGVSLAKPLTTVPITVCIEEEFADVIVSYAVGQAGLPIGRIDRPGPAIPRFSCQNRNAWQIAASCASTMQRGFNIDMSHWALWMDKDGLVNWGDFDEPGEIPVFESLDNLIEHSPDSEHVQSGLSMVQTYLSPHLKHSQLFEIRDHTRREYRTERALKVRHELADRGRTTVWYGTEHDRVC